MRECPCHAPLKPHEHPALSRFQKLIKRFLQHAKFSKPTPDPYGPYFWPQGWITRSGTEPLQQISTTRRAAVWRGQLLATAESGEDKGGEDRGSSAGQGLTIAKPLPLLAQLAGSLVQGQEQGRDANPPPAQLDA